MTGSRNDLVMHAVPTAETAEKAVLLRVVGFKLRRRRRRIP